MKGVPLLSKSRVFYGWFVVVGSALVVFGVAGSMFSFGVFLKPLTDEFEWSRGTLSLAFGTTFLLSGLLRPIAGYLADRHDPKLVTLAGVAILGVMLLLMPLISSLVHLFLIFSIMSIGITLGTGPALTKVVSTWFYRKRALTLGLVTGGGMAGALILVPAASSFLVLFSWEEAYLFLGVLLLALILPAGYFLIVNRPQDMGLQPQGEPLSPAERGDGASNDHGGIITQDSTFREALRTPIFWKLTFGYFV